MGLGAISTRTENSVRPLPERRNAPNSSERFEQHRMAQNGGRDGDKFIV
jgi:hypothetical protein